MEFFVSWIAYLFLFSWFCYSSYAVYKKSNPYLLQIIPSIFTTIGVFGTFIGIAYGLSVFDVNNITESIPGLLEWMKLAFYTSIWGIILSMVFSYIIARRNNESENSESNEPQSELEAIKTLIEVFKDAQKSNRELTESLILEVKKSTEEQKSVFKNEFELSNNLHKTNNDKLLGSLENLFKVNQEVKTKIADAQKSNKTLTESLIAEVKNSATEQKTVFKNELKLSNNLHNTNNDKLLKSLENLFKVNQEVKTEIVDSRKEQNNHAQKANDNTDKIIQSMSDNNTLIRKKFDEFGELLAKSNTEALVEAMEKVITDFNEKMNDLIQRLVQENFQELNNSVKRLNDWQVENKQQVQKLIAQFTDVSNNLQVSSKTIKEISDNTTKLTNENSHLSKLIKELQAVMVDDTKFKELINQVSKTIGTLDNTTNKFDNTTNKLNEWVKRERSIKESVTILIERLREIEKIKSINGEFWATTQKQMNEGVSIIANANKRLESDVKGINAEFYQRLNSTLVSLDELIRRLILDSQKRR